MSEYKKSHYLFYFRDNEYIDNKHIIDDINDDTIFSIDKTLESINDFKDPDTGEVFSKENISSDLTEDDCGVVINLIDKYNEERNMNNFVHDDIIIFGNMLNTFSGDHKFILFTTYKNPAYSGEFKVYILFKLQSNPNIIYAINTQDNDNNREIIKFKKPKNTTFEIKSNI